MVMFVIVTIRSLFWILSSISTFMIATYALGTPKWLLGKKLTTLSQNNRTIEYQDSLGLFNRCKYGKWLTGVSTWEWETRCYISATSFGMISSPYWKISVLALGVATFFLAVASIFGVVSTCKQLIRRKSLMNIAGIFQAFAGILLIVAIVFFPLGWDSQQVHKQCYEKDDKPFKFKLGFCVIGEAYLCAIGATFAAFFCSLFSFVADKAVFSDRVQDEILEGKQLICVF
ncbi:LHFPL tetraspan subfamily member 2 protein [Hydra vulgaris]|nr:LHFPL tetraspan subfamily member 2 protein [Hydra vulgaris]